MRRIVVAASILLISACAFAQPKAVAPSGAQRSAPAEQRVAKYLESIRGNPELVEVFLRDMPKGADLHNHLSGAVYAESYVQWAADDGLCVIQTTMTLSAPGAPCDAASGRPAAADALRNPNLYRDLVNAFSMRQFVPTLQSAHDHFFDTFVKFGAASGPKHTAQMVAEVVSRAAAQHVEYMELMLSPDGGKVGEVGRKITWDDNFETMRQQVDANGAGDAIAASKQNLDNVEKEVKRLLRCGESNPDPGCNTVVRYVFQVLRAGPREQVFTQIQIGFELAKADPRVVSINPVQPEDWYVPIRDYDLHMRMFKFFKQQYPQVRLTMHAGELAAGLVPPSALRSHIRDAVNAGAERIGHGVDVMQEDRPFELLKLLHDRNVMIEINLTSNDQILGVTGMRHPLPVYMKWGVPVAISTDDEGVARSDITHEYLRATLDYKLTYAQLKKMSRTGIEHGFMDEATRKQVLAKFDSDFAAFERDCCNDKP